MDIDVKLLKGLAQDKEIPFDVLVAAMMALRRVRRTTAASVAAWSPRGRPA
ncbi:hypothetical protein SMICM304S_06280 [Streptomyces microflavus]